MRGASVTLASLLWSCGWPAPACWAPSDQTPGWKQVELPPGALTLAAPADVDQYRTGERALSWQEQGIVSSQSGAPGSTELTLNLDGKHGDAVEVTFESRLGGANVEARGLTKTASYLLLPRTRMHETSVRLDLADPRLSTVVLTVHHHLRRAPRLVSWRIGQWQRPPGRAALLVYRQPAGRTLWLCDTPGQKLGFHPAWQSESPQVVSLRPTLVTRVRHWVWR